MLATFPRREARMFINNTSIRQKSDEKKRVINADVQLVEKNRKKHSDVRKHFQCSTIGMPYLPLFIARPKARTERIPR